MTPELRDQLHSILNGAPGVGWVDYTDIVRDKLEKKHFKELIEVCNNTYEQLHGKSTKVAKEIMEEPGYEIIFGLRKGKVL